MVLVIDIDVRADTEADFKAVAKGFANGPDLQAGPTASDDMRIALVDIRESSINVGGEIAAVFSAPPERTAKRPSAGAEPFMPVVEVFWRRSIQPTVWRRWPEAPGRCSAPIRATRAASTRNDLHADCAVSGIPAFCVRMVEPRRLELLTS